jgi:arylformamidase
MAKLFDLSQAIENGMTYFPGDPQPLIDNNSIAASPWRVSHLSFGSHTGTHIDAPCHFSPRGKTIDQYGLERFILPGLVASLPDLSPNQAIEIRMISNLFDKLPRGGALIIRTNWDRYWKTEDYTRHPYLTAQAADGLVSAGASLVGIDALNVDSTVDATCHVHEILLGNDLLIVENLRGLDQLMASKIYEFAFLPLPLTGLDGSPIRAVAREI